MHACLKDRRQISVVDSEMVQTATVDLDTLRSKVSEVTRYGAPCLNERPSEAADDIPTGSISRRLSNVAE